MDTRTVERWYCDTCPYSSTDMRGITGHQYHAPVRGWLGKGERHHMEPRSSAALYNTLVTTEAETVPVTAAVPGRHGGCQSFT